MKSFTFKPTSSRQKYKIKRNGTASKTMRVDTFTSSYANLSNTRSDGGSMGDFVTPTTTGEMAEDTTTTYAERQTVSLMRYFTDTTKSDKDIIPSGKTITETTENAAHIFSTIINVKGKPSEMTKFKTAEEESLSAKTVIGRSNSAMFYNAVTSDYMSKSHVNGTSNKVTNKPSENASPSASQFNDELLKQESVTQVLSSAEKKTQNPSINAFSSVSQFNGELPQQDPVFSSAEKRTKNPSIKDGESKGNLSRSALHVTDIEKIGKLALESGVHHESSNVPSTTYSNEKEDNSTDTMRWNNANSTVATLIRETSATSKGIGTVYKYDNVAFDILIIVTVNVIIAIVIRTIPTDSERIMCYFQDSTIDFGLDKDTVAKPKGILLVILELSVFQFKTITVMASNKTFYSNLLLVYNHTHNIFFKQQKK